MSSQSLYFYEIDPVIESSLEEILLGLSESQKMISPKYFYDERGSELFMEITRQPEYYLTRIEIGLLQRYATDTYLERPDRHPYSRAASTGKTLRKTNNRIYTCS